MKDVAKISITGLIGAIAAYFLIKKLPKSISEPSEKEEQYYYLQFPSIYLPANISEEEVYEIVQKIKNPKITPTFSPLGWKLEWNPIPIWTPVGEVSINLAYQQIPAISNQQINELATSLRINTKVEKEALMWKIILPEIKVKI